MGRGHVDTRVLSLSKIYILISVELVSTQDAAAPSWSGEVGVCVGWVGGCWHQGFVFEQDILRRTGKHPGSGGSILTRLKSR